MSGIPVWYSEGFNPHPYITFALPLSLGFESEWEAMDIRIDQDEFENEKVIDALKPHMPSGIEILGSCDPILKAGDIIFAEFEIVFDGGFSEFSDRFKSFVSAETIPAEKTTKKGGTKQIDLKEFIKEYSICEKGITLVLSAGGSKNLNPKLLFDTFEENSGLKLPTYSIIRKMLYTNDMEQWK